MKESTIHSTPARKNRGADAETGASPAYKVEMEPIKTPKIAHIVSSRLRRQIIMGELRPGDTLPTEAQLMAHFGISRPALREALRILEAESLIAIGRGIRGGATILQPTIEKLAQYGTYYLVANGTRFRDIHEARMLIEPAVAAQLAAKPRKDAVLALREVLQQGLSAVATGDLKAALLSSSEFHATLVRFSQNKALALLVGMLHDIVIASLAALREQENDLRKRMRVVEKSFQAYERLIELIEQGKSEETEQFWRQYMEKSARLLTTGHGNQAITIQT